MTSLELRRLKTPQTSKLVANSKQRHSILFDWKDAATKENTAIYDIGIKGLEELISVNPVFNEFRHTLFNKDTIDLERSTKDKNFNLEIHGNIKKFLLQLSPYFLRNSAQQCLEWLIRRFNINEHEIDEMMALILPYHETLTFVKCVQTMSHNNKWKWLTMEIQAPLPKQIIIKRAASHTDFLKFICGTILEAVDELKTKAYTLQSLFAFYLTVILGALHITNKIEDAVANIFKSLMKGLSSNILDFCAASMILISFLMTKVAMPEYLKPIIEKLDISHQHLRKESLLMLVIIYHTQKDIIDMINDVLLAKMIDNMSILTMLGTLYQKNINVLALCLPLIKTSLKNIHHKKNTTLDKKFVKTFLSELSLNNDDAEAVIRCILKTLQQMSEVTVKVTVDDKVIEIDSDDDTCMGDESSEDEKWYATLLRNLETRYPEAFDAIKSDIMSHKGEDSSSNGKSLKFILGSLLCATQIGDASGATIFEDLYHSSATNRIQAIKTMVNPINQLSTMPFSDDKKNLLVAGIVERLSDSDHGVVNEVLKFETKDLIKIVGEQNLIRKLKAIIDKHTKSEKWQDAVCLAIKHITSKELLTKNNEIEIFISIWPYMFPHEEFMINQSKTILQSDICDRFSIIKRLKKGFNNGTNLSEFNKYVEKQMETFLGMSRVGDIVRFVKAIPDDQMKSVQAFHIINLLTYSLSNDTDHKLSTEVLAIASKFSVQFGNIDIDIGSNYQLISDMKAIPVQVILKCIQTILAKTKFKALIEEDIDFTCKNDELTLIVKIYENLCIGLYSSSKKTNRLFNNVMLEFLGIVLPDHNKQLAFFSNFFINHYIDQLPDTPNCISIEPSLQLRSMRLFNALLTRVDRSTEITMEVFIRIISGLTSPFPAIRSTTYETIVIMNSFHLKPHSKIFFSLVEHKERLLSNSNELSVILFRIKEQHIELFQYVSQPKTKMIMKAALLNMLGLVNNVKYLYLVVDAALAILKKGDDTKRIILSPHESIVVNETIKRFTHDAIPLISCSGNCKIFFEKLFQNSNVFLQIDNKVHSVAVLVMNLNIFNRNETLNKFSELSKNQQLYIIDSIIKSATFSECDELRSKVSYFFKNIIKLGGKTSFNILTEMAKVTSVAVTPRNESTECFSQELIQTPAWKCGVTLLEYLHKKPLVNSLQLLRQLFPILEKCLKFDDQSMVEYTKQLVLSNILKCCELATETGPVLESYFKIELVVACIRGTQNPQVHHHALQLLTKLATMMPEAVLHNMVDIFTFVGTSVVRRDDTYIYQLISNIIKSIVPILKQDHVLQVLKAFSDAVMDVPIHRRSTLYEDLLRSLSPMQFLWKFLAILFEKELKDSKQESQYILKLTQIAIEITNLFDCEIIIETCCELIKFLRQQQNAVNEKGSEMDPTFKSIFNVELYLPNEFNTYRNRILTFITMLIKETSEFSAKWTSLSPELQMTHKKSFKKIIPAILDYIKASAKFQQSLDLSRPYLILYHLLELLYPEMLLQVVDALLCEENHVDVRIRIVGLLNKILESSRSFVNCETSILSLLDPLTDIVKSINNPEKLKQRHNVTLQKNSLVAIQLLSQILAQEHPEKFVDLLERLSKILKSNKEISVVSIYLIECIGEVCANVRVHAISLLHRFMPRITEVLDQLIARDINVNCFEVILKAIYRIVETLPLFLHPYLIDLIPSLCILWRHLQSAPSNISQNSTLKLDQIWKKLSSSLELRVLIPMIENNIYPKLLEQNKFNAVGPLMMLLLDNFGHVTTPDETADLVQNCNDLTTLFITVMEFRTKFHRHHHQQFYLKEEKSLSAITHIECNAVDVEEDFIIKTIVGLILKLTETPFRQLYNKVYQWSIENNGRSFDRAVTFYRLSSKISESLKGLFTNFARDIIQNSADLLKKKYKKKEIRASSTTPVTLIYNILETLNNMFLYSNQFINSDRFNILLEPLVNLLDNEVYLSDKNIEEILPKCFAQFAVAANDDVLWKSLVQQIVLKTKSDIVAVRKCALVCVVEVTIKLGKDSTLLQYIRQPLYELMEYDDPEIVAICKRSIPQLSKALNKDVEANLI